MAYIYSYNQGKKGEELAQKFLETHGYICQSKNFRIPGGEIDLVMQKNGILVFVEVKARSSSQFGEPEEAFHFFKKIKLLHAIQHYLFQQNLNVPWQLDLITLNFRGKNAYLKHFQNILQNE